MSVIEAFLVGMRHELRTPVNAILGYGQLLLEDHGDAFSAEARRDLDRVIEAGHHLLRIITDVLDEPVGDDISVCAARMRHALHTPLLTVQGLSYLLIEEQHDAAICDDLRRIDGAAVQLAKVSDSLEHSFRACVDAARNESLASASPGPALARPGLRPTDISAAMADSPERLAARTGSILVIDDEEINRNLLTRRLTHRGHVVFAADSGEAGLALAGREAVDVILLDVMMPGLSGYDVLSRIKADATLREIPVLMISALDQTASVTRCIALGADDYLTKPFDPLVLCARVSSCITKKRARDFELAYLRGVETVTAAALALETGCFTPDSLHDVGRRSDPLGNLARLFQRMGVEVAARERRLRTQVEQLVIAIDEERKAAQVAEITESDYFQKLKARAKVLVARNAARTTLPG